jgi:hypothetical protein
LLQRRYNCVEEEHQIINIHRRQPHLQPQPHPSRSYCGWVCFVTVIMFLNVWNPMYLLEQTYLFNKSPPYNDGIINNTRIIDPLRVLLDSLKDDDSTIEAGMGLVRPVANVKVPTDARTLSMCRRSAYRDDVLQRVLLSSSELSSESSTLELLRSKLVRRLLSDDVDSEDSGKDIRLIISTLGDSVTLNCCQSAGSNYRTVLGHWLNNVATQQQQHRQQRPSPPSTNNTNSNNDNPRVVVRNHGIGSKGPEFHRSCNSKNYNVTMPANVVP